MKYFSKISGVGSYLPPKVVKNTDLEEMLDTAAETLEYRVQNFLSLLMGLVEPLLILIMGAIVLAIVIAILLPIFDMNQLV